MLDVEVEDLLWIPLFDQVRGVQSHILVEDLIVLSKGKKMVISKMKH